MKPYVVANQKAGQSALLEDDLRKQIETEATLLICEDGTDMGQLVREALSRDCTRIVAAGGDGTVNAVANQLIKVQSRAELAVLPLGTGNDLARALGMPMNDPSAALEAALNAPARSADAVRVTACNGDWQGHMLNAGYGGLGGRLADEVDVDSKERLGAVAYWIAAVRRTLDMPTYRLSVEVDGRSLSLDAHGILVANGAFLAGGVAVAPEARLDDGCLDVAIVPSGNALDMIATILDVLRARHDEKDGLLTMQARELRCSAEPAMEFTADGEAMPGKALHFEILPKAIRLVAMDRAVGFDARRAGMFESSS